MFGAFVEGWRRVLRAPALAILVLAAPKLAFAVIVLQVLAPLAYARLDR